MRQCPRCRTENRARAAFCRACGARLTLSCPQCRRDLPLGASFCDACGACVAGPPAAPAAEPEASALLAAIQRHIPKEFAERLRAGRGRVARERRLVTFLFSDIKGYSTMAGALDPEEVVEIVNDAFEFLIGPVCRHEGTVAQFMGDAILAFFGAPIAHEDDAERAISAGLEIQQGARDYAARLERERGIAGFGVRVGINTGPVVVGEVGSDLRVTYTAVGDAINMAARMEQNAPAGGVLITEETYRLVRGAFDVQPMPPLTVKGRREPLQTFLVQRAKPRRFRLPARGVEGIATRMVGRDAELQRLQDALAAAIRDGEGQVLTVVGEAGVGKSRLADEFQNRIELLPEHVRLYRGRGHPETQARPYALLRDLFTFRFQIQDDDGLDAVRRKLEDGIAEADPAAGPGQAAVIGQLLGFDFSASPHLAGLSSDPQALRDRGLAELAGYFRTVSAQSPAVLLLEDLHWADDASLDAVNHLGRAAAHLRLLIVCLARPALFERRPYWGEGQACHSRLDLQPLSRGQSRQLVAEILQRAAEVPAVLRDLVVDGAEGNPFYIEELVKMLIERGVIVAGGERWRVLPERLATLDVPSSLTAVLQARLDALPPEEKSVLQQASVVGRVFWDAVVAYIHARDAPAGAALPSAGSRTDVGVALGALRGREMVYRREESAFAGSREYLFKNAILRDVTYESVLKRSRRAYHAATAEWLIMHAGDRLKEYSGLIAEHLEAAGEGRRAAGYLRRAGEDALARYAGAEAEAYLRRALGADPSPEERAALLAGLGEALFGQDRHPEAIEAWREGIELYRPRGDMDGVARLYARSARAASDAEDIPRSLALCREGLAVVAGAPSSPSHALLLHEAARACYLNALPAEAEDLCRRALDMAQRLGAVEVEADALVTLGILDWLPGEERRAALEQAVALAEERGLLEVAFRGHSNLVNEMIAEAWGSPASALQQTRRMQEIAGLRGSTRAQAWALGTECDLLMLMGDLRAAEGRVAAAHHLAEGSPRLDTVTLLVHRMDTRLFFCRGHWKESLQAGEAAWSVAQRGLDPQKMHALAYLLAFACWQMDRFGEGPDWERLEPLLTATAAVRWHSGADALCALSLVRSRQSRFTEAERWLEQAQSLVRSHSDALSLHLAAGELAACRGRWDEAVRAWSSAVEVSVQCGVGWWQACGLLLLADAYAGRGAEDDLARAVELYRQAQDRFSAMPAPGYVQVIEARLRELQDRSRANHGAREAQP